jgi:hypothetical protein
VGKRLCGKIGTGPNYGVKRRLRRGSDSIT